MSTKPLRMAFLVLPWIGMLGFAYLFIVTFFELAAADHYSSQSFSEMKEREGLLREYVKARNEHENDLSVFESMNWIDEYQYDGKYAPWVSTKLGLVKFDNDRIELICFTPTYGDSTDCPETL